MSNMNFKALPLMVGVVREPPIQKDKNSATSRNESATRTKSQSNNFEQILGTSLCGISDYLQNLKTSLPIPKDSAKRVLRRPVGSQNLMVGAVRVGTKSPRFVGDKLQSRFVGSVSLLANCKTNPPLKTSLPPAEWIAKKVNDDSVILQMNLSVPGNKSSKKQAIIPEFAMNKMKVATHNPKNASNNVGADSICDSINTKQIAQGNPLNNNIENVKLSQERLIANKFAESCGIDNNIIKQFEIDKSVILSEAKNLAYTTRKPANEFNMEVIKEGNKLIGKVIVDNVDMKQLLISNLLALQKTLKKAGVKVDRIDIVIRSEKRETINRNSEIRGRRSKDTAPFVKQADYKPKTTGYSKRFTESSNEDLTDKSQVPNSKKFFTIVQNDKKGARVTPLPQDSANKLQTTASEFRSMIDETKTGKNQRNFTEPHGRGGSRTALATRGQDNNSRLDNSQKVIHQDSSAKPDPKVDVKTPQNPAEKSNPQNSINKTNSETFRSSGYKMGKGLKLGLGKGLSVTMGYSERFTESRSEDLTDKSQVSNSKKFFTIVQNDKKGARATPLPQDSVNKSQATASEFCSMIDETKAGKNQGNFTEPHTESATRGQDNNSRLDNSQKVIHQDSSAKPDPKIDVKTPQNPAEKSNPQNPINRTNSESLRNSAYKTDNKLQISDKGLNLGLGKGHSVVNLQSELKFETLPKGIPSSNFEKLAEQLKLNFKGGRSEAKIELKPDWLGKLSIKLVIEDTKLAGKIVVDTLVAKHLLEHSLSDLKSALKSTGLEIENFNITLSEDSGQGKNSYGRATPYSRYPEKPDLPHSDWDWFFKYLGFSEGINYANETGRIDYFA